MKVIETTNEKKKKFDDLNYKKSAAKLLVLKFLSWENM